MAAAIGVRGDYDAARLRELAKRSVDAEALAPSRPRKASMTASTQAIPYD
jgi:hypothetical protein